MTEGRGFASHRLDQSRNLTARRLAQDPARNLGPKGKYSNLAGWYKSAENSPVVYIQHGHGPTAWTNTAFQTVMLNAGKWAVSPEAMAWARKNPTRIFKNVKPIKSTTN